MALKEKQLTTPSTYNIYDKGYRSGAQSSLFIGPIWVEEVVSLQMNTGSNDQPVYPYSSPYFDRLMLGNYLVSGTLGIAYSEPDYLLRIIQLVKQETMNADDLREIIERRKNVFANTLKHKLVTEKVLDQGGITEEQLSKEGSLTSYVYNYVDRITREIETSSYSGSGLNPMSFDMTVLKGNIYDETQAVEMYENVKINGTASVVVNDDSSLIELYSFTGRKKPYRETRTKVKAPDGYLSMSNLMQMAKEVSEQLIERLLDPPAIDVVENARRPSLMHDATKLAPSGLMNESSRFYGKEASFGEMVYSLSYDQSLSEYPLKRSMKPIQSTTELEIYEQGKISAKDDAKGIYLVPPRDTNTGRNSFDNSYGRIIHPDRESTAEKISAIATVTPTQLYEPIGGSMIMPRYRRNEFDIGSFYPPVILEEKTSFSYIDQSIESITATSLWCCLTGFRNTKSLSNDGLPPDKKEKSGDGDYIAEISQPVFTFAYIDNVRSKWVSSTDYAISIAEPCYIDYKYLEKEAAPNPDRRYSQVAGEKESARSKRAKEEFALGKYENDLVWKYNSETGLGTTASKINKGSDLATETIIEELDAEVYVYHEELSIPKVYEYSGEGAPPAWTSSTAYAVDAIVSIDAVVWKCKTAHTSSSSFASDASYWTEMGVWMDPHFFKITKTLSSSKLVTNFNKCVYLKPFVYLEGTRNVTNIQQEDVSGTPTWLADVVSEPIPSMPEGNSAAAAAGLAYFLSGGVSSVRRTSGVDEGCDFDFDYNWGISSASGYTNYGQALEINGVYFLTPKEDSFHNDELIANNGTVVKRSEIYNRASPTTPIASRKVHVFWLATIVPVKRSSNEQDSKKANSELPIKVFHDLSEPCGRHLQIYNLTRCDVMYIPTKKWYEYNPSGSTAQAIKNAITRSFEGLINVFTPTEYAWPLKRSMERVAGYLRGYGCAVNVNEIVDQVLKCGFGGSGIPKRVANTAAKHKVLEDTVSAVEWTLESAMKVALGREELKEATSKVPSYAPKDSLTGNAYTELSSMVRTIIKDKVKRKGMKVLEEIASTGKMKIYRDVMTPVPTVVSWAISSEDGYNDLLKISRSNAGGETSTTIPLGGYQRG